jgi:DNA-binding CsgD family transcriptional regulator
VKYKVEKRNAEIVQKINSGASCKEIASEFGLSRSRIQQIVSRHKIDVERKERSSKLLSKLKMVDNIDQKWPVVTLIQDLRFPIRAEQRLTEYFSGLNSSEMSLRDIMDFLITDYEKIPYDLYQVCPAYEQKHIGVKTYTAAVNHLSEQDLGDTFNHEWNKRLKKLVRFMQKRWGYIPDSFHQYGM